MTDGIPFDKSITYLVPDLLNGEVVYQRYDLPYLSLLSFAQQDLGIKLSGKEGGTIKIVDWDCTYMMSDDHEIYRKGCEQELFLKDLFIKGLSL